MTRKNAERLVIFLAVAVGAVAGYALWIFWNWRPNG